ncbi:MAG: hypothetical protein IPN86_16105 [Saprospiraceae bacterium]|nr:hypothetical protein [Saprospiraceae bacterium]
MRLVFLLVTMLYSHYYGISQSNLPDWILARPSHPNVGYIANVVIPASWPLGPFGDIYVQIPSSNGDSQDNIIIEAYDNQILRQIRNTISASGTYGVNLSIGSGVMHNDSLVYKAISQIGNNDCATTSGKDELYVDDGTGNFSPIGEIEGDGTSNITKHYEYIHTSPSLGINYYRIKQLDYDGKYSYSDIASVRYDGSG